MPSTKKTISSAFENKLLRMLSSENDNIIQWNKEGDGFIILNAEDFVDKILPLYFKTRKFNSFVRQLNYYGFHKYTSSAVDPDLYGFRHPSFHRYPKSVKPKTETKSGVDNISNAELNIRMLESQNNVLKTILNEKENEIMKLQKRCSDLELKMGSVNTNLIDSNPFQWDYFQFYNDCNIESLPSFM